MIACPRCGVTNIYAVWEIGKDGTVVFKCTSCPFGETVKLENWSPF